MRSIIVRIAYEVYTNMITEMLAPAEFCSDSGSIMPVNIRYYLPYDGLFYGQCFNAQSMHFSERSV